MRNMELKSEKKINVKGTEIAVFVKNDTDFISLTDITGNFKEGSGLIGKWISNKNTLEYLGIWEKINNPDFNYTEFGVIKNSEERFKLLNKTAIEQITIMINNNISKKLSK